MSVQTFRRVDTGEVKAFRADSYRIDTTNQHSTHVEIAEVNFYRAADGTRIDRQADGSFQEKWGEVWVAESTQS